MGRSVDTMPRQYIKKLAAYARQLEGTDSYPSCPEIKGLEELYCKLKGRPIKLLREMLECNIVAPDGEWSCRGPPDVKKRLYDFGLLKREKMPGYGRGVHVRYRYRIAEKQAGLIRELVYIAYGKQPSG